MDTSSSDSPTQRIRPKVLMESSPAETHSLCPAAQSPLAAPDSTDCTLFQVSSLPTSLPSKSLSPKNLDLGNFPGGPVVRTLPSNAGVRVQSLIRELRFPCASARKQEHKQMKQYSNNFNEDCENGLHPKNLQKRKKKKKQCCFAH